MSSYLSMKELQTIIDAYLAKEGVPMSKQLQAPSYGLFSSNSGTWDKRIARSYKQAVELSAEGFTPEGKDIGIMLLNAIMAYNIPKKN